MTKQQLKNIIRECLKENLNENLPFGESQNAKEASKSLIRIVNMIQDSNLATDARAAAAEIIRIIDVDQARFK